jgi:hypothetical protein
MKRSLVAAVTAAGALGLAGAGPGAGAFASAPAAAATPTCTASGLSASLHHGLAGGMNHQGVELRLKNTSGHTCALRGYPGLGLENARHKTLKSTTTWGSTWYADNPGTSTIALKPGQSAQAVIAWTHADEGTSGARHAAYLQVTPPASTTHKTVKFTAWVDNGKLSVTALARSVPLRG